ncbi:MAG: branched-chain amino acid ABC transporter permease [Spirochaetota bacterium]
MRKNNWLVPLAFLVAGALLVFITQRVFNDYVLVIIDFIFLYIILAVSLNITNGYAGLFSLGHPAFMTIGGYIAALLIMPVTRKAVFLPNLPGWFSAQQWPLLPAVLTGGSLAALLAIIIGLPVLRLRGHYLAVATLGFIIIIQVLIRNLEELTRGPLGLNGLLPLTTMWWIYLWLVITVYVAWKIKFSSLGRTLFAIRDDELAAESLGIPLLRTKIVAFVVGAFFAGVAGGLWTHLVTVITPNSFSILLSFNLVVIIVVGGNGSITGSVLSAALMTVLVEVLRPIEERSGLYGISQIIFAVSLLFVLVLRPKGFFGRDEPGFMLARRKAPGL